MVYSHGLASLYRKLTSVDVELGVLGSLIRIRDTSEVLDDTGTGLGVESFDVTTLANLKTGTDVALIELEAGIYVNLPRQVSACTIW